MPPCKLTIQKYIRKVRGSTKPILAVPRHETTAELKKKLASLEEENRLLRDEIDRLKRK
jgi:regulator of replication initiation timing